ncbi:hypothetical protein C8F04DRAFT_1401378 [Mycena alexandri]|uniref:Uncharacterized protein n=1 Tax=Mycena alexandri TaxID=1745969 RepID=A0AAD6SAD1_9AGAR|nr:hypothetical protein C8F04DRAFT_1401378 [Mycena alexandri]
MRIRAIPTRGRSALILDLQPLVQIAVQECYMDASRRRAQHHCIQVESNLSRHTRVLHPHPRHTAHSAPVSGACACTQACAPTRIERLGARIADSKRESLIYMYLGGGVPAHTRDETTETAHADAQLLLPAPAQSQYQPGPSHQTLPPVSYAPQPQAPPPAPSLQQQQPPLRTPRPSVHPRTVPPPRPAPASVSTSTITPASGRPRPAHAPRYISASRARTQRGSTEAPAAQHRLGSLLVNSARTTPALIAQRPSRRSAPDISRSAEHALRISRHDATRAVSTPLPGAARHAGHAPGWTQADLRALPATTSRHLDPHRARTLPGARTTRHTLHPPPQTPGRYAHGSPTPTRLDSKTPRKSTAQAPSRALDIE